MCLGAAGVAISLMKEQPQVKAENRICNRFPSCELRSTQKKSRRNASICVGGGMPREPAAAWWAKLVDQEHTRSISFLPAAAPPDTSIRCSPWRMVIRELRTGSGTGRRRRHRRRVWSSDLVPQAGFELDTIEKVPFPRQP